MAAQVWLSYAEIYFLQSVQIRCVALIMNCSLCINSGFATWAALLAAREACPWVQMA